MSEIDFFRWISTKTSKKCQKFSRSEAVDLSPYVIPYVFATPQQVKKKNRRPDVRTSKNNFPKTFSLFTKIPYLIPQPHLCCAHYNEFSVVRPPTTAAVDRSDRSRDRSIESIGSIDSIIFRSFKIFGNSSWRRCGSNGPKIIKIRAILAIFWSFEDFCRKIRRPYRRRRKQWGGSGVNTCFAYR